MRKVLICVVIGLAGLGVACQNPTESLPPERGWETLYVKMEVSGILSNPGDSSDSSLVWYMQRDLTWGEVISFADNIPRDSSGRYDQHNVFWTKEEIIYRNKYKEVKINAYSDPNASYRSRGNQVDQLVATIYIRMNPEDEYLVYATKKAERRSYNSDAPIQVRVEADLTDYRP